MQGPSRFDESNEVDKLRVRALYRHSSTAQTIGLANAVIALTVLQQSAPLWGLIVWGLASALVFVGRQSLHHAFTKKYSGGFADFDPAAWERYFAIGTVFAGALWAVAAVAMIPGDSVASQSFIAFLIAGTTAGAAVVYSVSTISIFAFLLPATVPFAIRLALEASRIQGAMALLLVLYVVMVGLTMRGLNRLIVDSIRMRFVQGRLLRELKETQDRLIQSAKMSALGEMAAGIAHEINNPLSIIHFYATHLKESGLPQNANDVLDKIDATSSRIAKIVSGLRAFARGDAMDAFQSVSVESIVNETMELCKIRQKRGGIGVAIEKIPEDIVINCRTTQMTQILLNLMNNAFDAVEGVEKPHVVLEVRATGDTVSILVTDNGPGIPPEIREKIMQPFFTTKEVGKGTGLGLSIAHGIASAHGGQLTLDDGSKQTRFVLTLPRLVAASPAPIKNAAS